MTDKFIHIYTEKKYTQIDTYTDTNTLIITHPNTYKID